MGAGLVVGVGVFVGACVGSGVEGMGVDVGIDVGVGAGAALIVIVVSPSGLTFELPPTFLNLTNNWFVPISVVSFALPVIIVAIAPEELDVAVGKLVHASVSDSHCSPFLVSPFV